jgi:HSP20 family protein
MADRMDQQRPANEGQKQSDQSKNLARRDDQGTLSYYGAGNYSPFDLMRRFSEDVDRMFASLGFGSFGSMFQPWGTTQRRPSRTGSSSMGTLAWAPSVDVNTRGDDLVVAVDLPGIKPENVQIECDDNQLIIRGETKDEHSQEEKERGYLYSERSYGSFYRSIPLPQGVNADNARANFNNGVLEVTFPDAAKSLMPQRRRIPIQGTQQQPQDAQMSQPTQSSQPMQGSQGSQGMQGEQTRGQSTGESSQTGS